MLLPLPVILLAALAPPLAAQLLRARVPVVVLAAALAWAALAVATFALIPPPAAPAPGMHPVEALDLTGVEAVLFAAFAIGCAVAALIAAITARFGHESRPLTLTGLWLGHGGLAVAIGPGRAWPPLAEIALTAAFAGVLTLVYALLIRPLIQRLRRPA